MLLRGSERRGRGGEDMFGVDGWGGQMKIIRRVVW